MIQMFGLLKGNLIKVEKKAFTLYEIAEFCRVIPSIVKEWIENGLIPVLITPRGHKHVWAEDLICFLKKNSMPIPSELTSYGKSTILIVDDDELIRQTIKRMIQEDFPGVVVVEAVNGEDAGIKINQFAPELVILDIKLPGIDGFRVSRMIRSYECFKHIKILAMSGCNIEEYRKRASDSGIDDFLEKPFNMDQMKEAVGKLIGQNNH